MRSYSSPITFDGDVERIAPAIFAYASHRRRLVAEDMSDRQMRRVVGSLREAGLVELAHAQRREKMTRTQRRERVTLVQRLIGHIQGIGASE